jgi:hypothetical protein
MRLAEFLVEYDGACQDALEERREYERQMNHPVRR